MEIKTKPISPDWPQTLFEIECDLRNLAGHLRRFRKFALAGRVDAVANKLDPNEIKPAPVVFRSISA